MAFERLRHGTEVVPALPVPRPPEGTVSVTFVGHATVMITTAHTRLLTDPLLERSFYGLRRAKEAGVHPATSKTSTSRWSRTPTATTCRPGACAGC